MIETTCRSAARRLLPLAALCAGAVAALPAAAADTGAQDFFRGKQIRYYTMGSPGGGYDTYMRTMIPYLEKRLGADIVPLNETGAGGLIAMNRTLTASPDGLTILLTSGEGAITAQLYGLPGVHYDVRKMVVLGRVSGEPKVVLLGKKAPFDSVADMVKSSRPVIWAASGKTDGNADFAAILAYATGMKSKIIPGYKGSGGMNMAIENGEVDGRVISDEAAAVFMRGGTMKVITTLDRERSAQFPKVPTVFEEVKLTPNKTKWIDWRASIAAVGRVIVVTPGTPADRVAFLRKAVKDVLTDPVFVAEAKKRRLDVNYATPEKVKKLIDTAMGTLNASELAKVKDIVLKKYYTKR